MDRALHFNTPAVDQLTTDAYVDVTLQLVGSRGNFTDDVTEILLDDHAGPFCFTITNSDALNDLDFRVLGGNVIGGARADMEIIGAEAAVVATETGSFAVLRCPWKVVVIQVKATVGASQGDAEVHGRYVRS